MSNEKIVVNVNSQSRMYQIVATLLAIAAVGMLAYVLAENGWLDLAATFLTMFLFQMTKLLFANGLLKVPAGSGKESFQGTTGFLKTAAKEFKQWQANSPMWRLALLAFGYTMSFMLARMVMQWALGIFTNVWVAGAVAALIGALIIFPQLFSQAWRTVSGKVKVEPEPRPEVVVEEIVIEEDR